VSSEGEGGESVHNDADSEQLNESQKRLVRRDSGYGSDDGGGDVGRDLELQELVNGVDTTIPHDSLHGGSEVVVHEGNASGFFGDLSAGGFP